MTIKIVTDSTCDLPPSLLEEWDITVIPLYINFTEDSYLDGVDITRVEFYEALAEVEESPTTAVPGVDAFGEVYQRLADQGAEEILSIHISSALSATSEVAQKAAEDAPVPVRVLDSGQLSLGVGFQALRAAEMASEGKDMARIVEVLKEEGRRTYVFAALDTLKYLRKSGRMNPFIAGIGSLLDVKPILRMNQGKPSSELVRTRKKSLQRVVDHVRELAPIQEIALVHSNAPQEAEALWEELKTFVSDQPHPLSAIVTPVIGSHIGPGAVGFAFRTKA
ncbi:MAG: DegV family protein [Anaerolineales bacterium]|nr:DegV family protein [Anaerolineales bacterium]